MKFLKQFCIIIFITFIGEILNKLIPLPIPASIYGIIIMFLALQFKIINPENVQDTGKFLINIMPVMFIPAAVGLLSSWGIFKSLIFEYLTITVVTTFLVMGVSGRVTQSFIKQQKGKDNNE